METISNLTSDKRKYPRVESSLPVQYRDLRKSSTLPTGSLTNNISEGGLCFRSNEFISLACRLVVEISLPTASKPIKAISKVAWIRKLPASEQYELGNRFLEITREDKAHIINFVNRVMGANL